MRFLVVGCAALAACGFDPSVEGGDTDSGPIIECDFGGVPAVFVDPCAKTPAAGVIDIFFSNGRFGAFYGYDTDTGVLTEFGSDNPE